LVGKKRPGSDDLQEQAPGISVGNRRLGADDLQEQPAGVLAGKKRAADANDLQDQDQSGKRRRLNDEEDSRVTIAFQIAQYCAEKLRKQGSRPRSRLWRSFKNFNSRTPTTSTLYTRLRYHY